LTAPHAQRNCVPTSRPLTSYWRAHSEHAIKTRNFTSGSADKLIFAKSAMPLTRLSPGVIAAGHNPVDVEALSVAQIGIRPAGLAVHRARARGS
jgi:hypothetical protein